MFKKIKCNSCQHEYDDTFDECPKCHSPNKQLDPNFKNIQMMPFGKQIGLFAMGLGGFELLALLFSVILVGVAGSSIEEALANMILNSTVYVMLFISLILITAKDLKKLGKSFAKWEPYIAGACCFLFMIFASLIYSRLLSKLGVQITDNDNQHSIDTTSSNFPFTSLVIFGVIGPICEELTYRVGLFSFLKRISKWLAYTVTIIVFTLIHFNFQATSIVNELLNLPYYIIGAFVLTFAYDKFGFAGSVTTHVLNNVISLLPFVISAGVLF